MDIGDTELGDEPAPAAVVPLSEQEHEDRALLHWFQRNAPDLMSPESWRTMGELDRRMWDVFHAHADEQARTLAPKLTATKVAQLERDTKAGRGLSGEDAQLWVAAVTLAKPTSRREWRRYYRTPIADILFARKTTGAPGRLWRGRRRRRPARARSRSPGRREPDPPDSGRR